MAWSLTVKLRRTLADSNTMVSFGRLATVPLSDVQMRHMLGPPGMITQPRFVAGASVQAWTPEVTLMS